MNEKTNEGDSNTPVTTETSKPVMSAVETTGSRPQATSMELYYGLLHSQCGGILKESFAFDSSRQHQISHNFIGDIEKWIALLSLKPETDLLRAALREYQFALLALVLGQYRQAFMALRLFLELGLGSVFLSANELQLRVWLRGRRDINWRPLISPD